MKIRAVIFDQDGVLVDSEPIHFLMLEKFFKQHGYVYNLSLHEKYFGYNAFNFFTHLNTDHGYNLPIPYMIKESQKYAAEFEERIQLMPNALPLLNELKQHVSTIGLATGTYRELTNRNLDRLRIKEFFQETICGDEIKNGKPNPEIYLKTAEKLGIAPEKCLVIEDAPAGIEAARTAGMTVISYHAIHNQKADLSQAQFQIQDLRQVLTILETLNKDSS